jgi:hypothetical protein
MENNLLDYYTIDEVASKSGLASDQVLRLGMSGSIIFSILEHKPKNFEEVDEYTDEDGRNIVRTRRNETTTLIGNSNPGLQIKYISTEDVINVITNEKECKSTLVRGLYETRELDPKKGKWMLNCPLSISQKDLVVKAEEWERFERGDGKRIASYLPLRVPEKVTITWLVNNISIGGWISVVAIIFSVFSAGVYFSETGIYKEVKAKFTVEQDSDKSLNK